MNSILINNEEKEQELKYPCLMQSKERIVLMTKQGYGTVVVGYPLGYYNDTWIMDDFTPLNTNAQIILSNDPIKEESKQDDIIRDKDLVWCVGNRGAHTRRLRFYDNDNKCTYNSKGERNGMISAITKNIKGNTLNGLKKLKIHWRIKWKST